VTGAKLKSHAVPSGTVGHSLAETVVGALTGTQESAERPAPSQAAVARHLLLLNQNGQKASQSKYQYDSTMNKMTAMIRGSLGLTRRYILHKSRGRTRTYTRLPELGDNCAGSQLLLCLPQGRYRDCRRCTTCSRRMRQEQIQLCTQRSGQAPRRPKYKTLWFAASARQRFS
jgi:hypothetical protein